MKLVYAALAALIFGQSANAAVVTYTRSGTVLAAVPQGPPNPAGLTSLPGINVGDRLRMSVTFDTDDLYDPGTMTSFFGSTLTDPSIRIVQLGNGNPVNAYSLTVGTQRATILDQMCFGDATCAANNGMEFPLGPTAFVRGTQLLGVDSCLWPQGVGQGVRMCNLVLNMLTAGPPRNLAIRVLGEARADTYFLGDTTGRAVLMARWDGSGVGGVPEPANWAMLITGFSLTGAAARRRRAVAQSA